MDLLKDLLKNLLKFINIRTFIVLGVNISFIKEGSYNINTGSCK